MSIFTKLMGGTFESNRDDGLALLEQGQIGEARLAFERALKKRKTASADEIELCRKRIRDCRQELATTRLRNADLAAGEGDFATAIEELENAREICDDPDIVDAINERFKEYDAMDARSLAGDSETINEEDLLTIIAGTWTEAQADEYASLPESITDAVLAGHDGDHKKSIPLLREIIDQAKLTISPKYIWFELGRELLGDDQFNESIEALDHFLNNVESEKPEDEEQALDLVRMQCMALGYKAGALVALERLDDAEQQLIESTRLASEDHTVFLGLGNFLRRRGKYEDALRALETAHELMGQMHPDIKVIRELGFTYLAMDNKKEAIASLAGVVEHHASRGEHSQFDPETTVALARLYEDNGEALRAADLFRHLAVGHDVKRHFEYNLEAARLLSSARAKAGLVQSYFTRASELAETEEQQTLLETIKHKVL
jgi:tetratricopeptide (TPR) repeat protein